MKQLRKIGMICGFILVGYTANAQPGNPSTPAPFGFVEILLGAGALYGGNKIYQERKKKIH